MIYHCAGGVLLVPTARCVGPECRGAGAQGTIGLGFRGALDEGSRGSFMQANRLIGTTAFDGVEISKGLAAIDQLRDQGDIDAYYAGAAKKAYRQRLERLPEREAPFETPSPFGTPLAPGALGRRYKGVHGDDVGPSVSEACACTPREPDAIDPVSGWLIYYVPGGVLLTPSKKCIAGGGRPSGFWANVYRGALRLVTPTPQPPPPGALPPPGGAIVPLPPGIQPIPTPPATILCHRPPNFWPDGIIAAEGGVCPPGWVPYP